MVCVCVCGGCTLTAGIFLHDLNYCSLGEAKLCLLVRVVGHREIGAERHGTTNG